MCNGRVSFRRKLKWQPPAETHGVEVWYNASNGSLIYGLNQRQIKSIMDAINVEMKIKKTLKKRKKRDLNKKT